MVEGLGEVDSDTMKVRLQTYFSPDINFQKYFKPDIINTSVIFH